MNFFINNHRYNLQSHPLPFMKASQVFAPKKQVKERPDLEEAIEESDEGEAPEAALKEEEEDNDLSKDKYIKAPKKKPAPKAASGGKGKKRAGGSDVEDSEPKKAKSTKGKRRAKK
jgi:replication factor C subunit 1